MSRARARRQISGAELRHRLEAEGIIVRCPSNRGLAEEAPFAYKDVDRVVGVVEQTGLAGRVAQLIPLGVVKGWAVPRGLGSPTAGGRMEGRGEPTGVGTDDARSPVRRMLLRFRASV